MEKNGARKKRGIINALVLLLLCLVFFRNGVSHADDLPVLASLQALQILTEAEVLRYERIMRETSELLGELRSAEEARGRAAELSEEAEKAALPEFRIQWGISNAQAQNYHDAVKYLMNLYKVYISVLQNLQASPVIPRLGEDRPSDAFSIAYYDELRGEYARLRKGLEAHKSALKAHADNLQMFTAKYKRQQALAASLTKSINKPDTQAFLLMQNRLETEGTLASLSISYTRMEVELSYSRAAASAYEEMAELLGNARENIRFTEEDLDSTLFEIQETITAREAEFPKTIDKLARAGEEISGMLPQSELYASLGQGFSQRNVALYRSAGDSPARAKAALLAARYAAERFRMYELMSEIRVLSSMTVLWRTRHDVFTGEAAGEALWGARADAQHVLDQVDKDEQFIYQNLENIQSYYFIVEALTRKAEPETDQILHQILDVLAEIQMHMHSKVEITLRAQRLLAIGAIDESTEKIDSLRFAQRVSKMRRDFAHAYMGRVLWRGSDYEVTTYDLTLAVSTLLIGLLVSSLFSRLAVRVIAHRRNIDNTFLTAVQRILFYLGAFFCFMLALDAINVPLTAFAFAGGAITIAVGFGAKVVFSNQISGMMIFFSRSFGHGDIIEIDGVTGVVQEIGMRATLVYTNDGAKIMVPNSYFMENKIVNYTRSEPMKRDNFRMRVAGGSDPKEVEAILTAEVRNYRNLLKNKEPFVVLADFSQRSIDFDVYYWYDCKKENSLVIASHIRGKVLQKLRERGIRPYDPHERILTRYNEIAG